VSYRHRIEFGTAGLRGPMKAGFAYMNDLVVVQAAQGLRDYLQSQISNSADRGIVIGYDHRHNSQRWGEMVAQVFLDCNIKVYLHRGPVHTPIVPFSVSRLKAACGVMVTASHNPKVGNFSLLGECCSNYSPA